MWRIGTFLLFSFGLFRKRVLGWVFIGTFVLNCFLISSSSLWLYVNIVDWKILIGHLKILFVLLSLIILLILVLCINKENYEFWFYLLTVFKVLFFLSKKLVLFYIFFELRIIPILIIILNWGLNPERLNAGMYMIIYTFVGSLPLLVGLVFFLSTEQRKFTHMLEGVKNLQSRYTMAAYITYWVKNPMIVFSWLRHIQWLTFMFVIRFFIKLPLYGVHLWLPKAHVEAPTEGSMVLARVLLKLGIYGLMRINQCLWRFVDQWRINFVCWALWGLLIVRLICFRQIDLKILIAYSSVFHMLLVAFIIKKGRCLKVIGLLLLAVGHGFCSSVLFFNVGNFYNYRSTRKMNINTGWMWKFPVFMFIWLVALVLNCNFPPRIKFFAELIIIFSRRKWISNLSFVVFWSVFIGGLFKIYLFMVKRHGKFIFNLNNTTQLTKKNFFISFIHIILKIIVIIWWWLIYNNSVLCINNFLLLGGYALL